MTLRGPRPSGGKRPRYSAVRGAQARAIAKGAQVHETLRVEWDVSAWCTKPVAVELHARPDRRAKRKWVPVGVDHMGFNRLGSRFVYEPSENRSSTLTMHVPCRKCAGCLRRRAHDWKRKAVSELTQNTLAGGRTWLVTLTLPMDMQHRYLALARARLDEQGIDFEQLPEKEQFVERCRAFNTEVQKWLKLVRKNSPIWDKKFVGPIRPGEGWQRYDRSYGRPDSWDNDPVSFRYLWVTEVHGGGGAAHGLPHMHLLIHELAADLRERRLRRKWSVSHGHAQAKLVTSVGGGVYICKYLSKDARARVRASARYGEWSAPLRGNEFTAASVRSSELNVIRLPSKKTRAAAPSAKHEVAAGEFTSKAMELWPELSTSQNVVVLKVRKKESKP